ncbi:hypothetical protein HELRODRAFT_172600 [Helobdella robusta]|uniref:Uncharacterized protein n=1 Tax=Helobdella robusta TaxID=6412 RepID=T1F5L3_HELRO|nr:hypothetical protein HELRODRAFT_172600 [Helobdella robusta]ESO04244.1 hypothetical protein HELRODRAFT_172600 [Helobdella robusta]
MVNSQSLEVSKSLEAKVAKVEGDLRMYQTLPGNWDVHKGCPARKSSADREQFAWAVPLKIKEAAVRSAIRILQAKQPVTTTTTTASAVATAAAAVTSATSMAYCSNVSVISTQLSLATTSSSSSSSSSSLSSSSLPTGVRTFVRSVDRNLLDRESCDMFSLLMDL